MAFTQWANCTNNNLSLEQIIGKWLLVQDKNGNPIFKTTTILDVLENSMLPYRNTALKLAPQVVKNTPGSLLGWNCINTNAYAVYLKFYDKATAAVVATDVPVLTLYVPANTPFYQAPNSVQHVFANGIGVSCGKDLADNGPTDITTGVMVNLIYN
jgi:hypothetical protein